MMNEWPATVACNTSFNSDTCNTSFQRQSPGAITCTDMDNKNQSN